MSEQNKFSRLAFTLVELLLLVCIVAIIALMVTPNFVRSGHSPANACINNLRQIDAAANQFALEHHLTNGDLIRFPSDLTAYIKLNRQEKIPPCPSGGFYFVARVGNNPICTLGTTVTPAHILQ